MRIAKGGESVIIIVSLIGVIPLISYLIFKIDCCLILSLFFVIFSLFMLYFFRDPDRDIENGGVVSPADGRILSIKKIEDKDVGKSYMITIFMNIWNVHVNRAPINGTVISKKYVSGKHLPAFHKNADENERIYVIFNTDVGRIKTVQIAGIFARRVVSYLNIGDKVNKGDRIGLIRFGSRVDLYLPLDKTMEVCVKEGDMVHAGEDKIAEVYD